MNAIIEAVCDELRLERAAEIAAQIADRMGLEQRYGRVWNTSELQQEFEVSGFAVPFVVVIRKSDGAVGSLEFQHYPRFYFNFVLDHEVQPVTVD